MKRELPIVDSDGNFRERAGLWAWCYLMFPDAEFEAERAGVCLFEENESIAAGTQPGYGKVGRAVQDVLLKDLLLGRLSGLVFWQMYLNKSARGEARFKQALFTVSEWASTTKTVSGRSLPSDPRRLKRNFKRFRNAMYFWGVFDLMDPTDLEDLFGGSGDPEPFLKFLAAAAELERRCDAVGFEVDNPALKDWNPWAVPACIKPDLRSFCDVNFPSESDEIRTILATYKNTFMG